MSHAGLLPQTYDKAERPSTALPEEIQREKEMMSEYILQQRIILPNSWGPARGCKTGSLDMTRKTKELDHEKLVTAILIPLSERHGE
jgi:hypothetical protein